MRVLPLPMGEVPLEGAERAFLPSQSLRDSSPRVGAKGKTDCDRWESLKGHTSDIGRLLAKTRISCRFSCRGGQWPPAFYADFQRKWAASGRPYLLFRRFSENCMRPHPALRATCTLRYDCHRKMDGIRISAKASACISGRTGFRQFPFHTISTIAFWAEEAGITTTG